jgi:hypothetical protein
MFTPADEKLRDIMEETADDLISMVEMELDEGSWVRKFYQRTEQLGLEMQDQVKMRGVADEWLSLQIAKSCLERLQSDYSPSGTEEPDLPPDKVFIQGAGWVEQIRKEIT